MKEIESYIKNYFGVAGSDLTPVANLFEANTLKKGEYLVKLGQYTHELSFIKKGYIRVFAPSPSAEKDITQWISTEGMFITELSSFVFNTASRFDIQAITDCELYTINRTRYNAIGDVIKNWAELDKLFIAKCFITLKNRVFNQLSMSAEQKFNSLFKQNPELFNQVPLQYIASMLGMTPETLSRLRKKLNS